MSKKTAGIDISDRSIELVSVLSKKENVISGVVRTELPAGIVSRGEIQDYDELLKRIRKLLGELFGGRLGSIEIGMSLPESRVYSKVAILPTGLEEKQYGKALEISAAKEFPYDVGSDMISSFVSVKTIENRREFLYSTTQLSLAHEYENLLREAGAEPVFMESESSALSRGAISAEASSDVLLADIGARTTMIATLGTHGEPVLSSAVPVGGDLLTTAIESRLDISLEEAEKAKRRGGLDPKADEGRVMMIIQRPFDQIASEIQATISYYKRKTGREVKKIVLAGGTSLLPGIMDYMVSHFEGVEVERADPLKRVSVAQNAKLPPRFKKESVLYTTAVGAALRAAGVRDRPGPNLLPSASTLRGGKTGPLNFIRTIFKKTFRLMSPTKKDSSKKKAPTKKKTTKKTATQKTTKKAEEKRKDTKPEKELKSETGKDEVDKSEVMAGLNEIVEYEDGTREENLSAEKDFGMGVGDILGESPHVEEGKKEEGGEPESDTEKEESEKISVESILQGRGDESGGDFETEKTAGKTVSAEGKGGRSFRWSMLVPIIVPVLVILVIAVGAGWFGGAGRDSVSKIFSSFGSFFGTEEQKVQDQAPAPVDVGPSVPSLVSMNVMLSSAEEEGEGLAVPLVGTRTIETDVSASDTFQATGEASAEDATAVGTVTIVNETSTDYRFVETTRLLSSEDVLFRMENASDIPANGTVDVEVYADEAGPSGDIGPSRFTIPGLSEDLQQYVYGRSRTAMTGGSGTVTAVAEEDIEAARSALSDRLLDEAKENFRSMISEEEIVLDDLITSNELESKLPEIGQVGSTFEASMTVQFSTLVVPEAELRNMLEVKKEDELPENVSAGNYGLGTILHTVEAYDTTSGRAEIRIEAPVQKK